jgi:hypothetical protein
MHRVKRVSPKPGFQLEVVFESGLSGLLDLSNELDGPVFEPLLQPSFFDQVHLDEFGVICWPNGADLAPEFVYEQINKSQREVHTH